MKHLHFITTLFIAIFMVACNNNEVIPTGVYHLSCELSKKFSKDSATLYIIESDYNCLALEGLSIAKDNTFSWDGHIDGAHAAFIRFQNDSTPFYFILEPGTININITTHGWSIVGSKQNRAYMHTLNNRQKIIDAKKDLWRKYQSQCNDSTLTQEQEIKYLEQDSVLTDSLQRYLTWRMKVGDPVSLIIKERLFKTLTTEYQKKF